jgi:hypothetical protein
MESGKAPKPRLRGRRNPPDGDVVASARQRGRSSLEVHDGGSQELERHRAEQEKAAWREVAYGYGRALRSLDADHPEFAMFRRGWHCAAFVAGLPLAPCKFIEALDTIAAISPGTRALP